MRSFLALMATMLALMAVAACGPSKTGSSKTGTGFTAIDPPAAFSFGRRCRLQTDSGAMYFVELPTSARSSNMCDHSKQYYREADFQAIPGLTRQCVLDSDEEKAANGGVVGIYSGETEASVYAARAICANAGH